MKKLILLLIFSLISSLAQSQEVNIHPILRPNTEMHAAAIRKVDTNGRFLVTASDDKTVKLWNLETGEHIRTFRLPIGNGNEGKIYSCAISPDGDTVAAAGWTKIDPKEGYSVYIFDTYTGLMKAKVNNMGNVINDLEFSKDGQYLAAALGIRAGVKIISAYSWKLHKNLTGYGGSSLNIAFNNMGWLATVSYDQNLRIYNSNFNLIKKIKLTAGKKPYSIAISPDDNKIAIGYDDTARIQVFNARNLKLLYEPNTSGIRAGSPLEMLTWSDNGKYLFAGGLHQKYIDKAWWHVIRRYEKAGKGNYKDFKATRSTLMDIKSIDGRLVFVGYQPDFGKMDYNGNIAYYKKGESLDFRNYQFNYLKVLEKSITFKPANKTSYTFDLTSLILNKKQNNGYLYVGNKPGISIKNWKDSYRPKLNNKFINFLQKNEFSRSITITENNKILWGTEWNLYCTNSKGKRIWKRPIPGIVWAVNSIKKLIVAIYDDGTIRWHRLSDGKELAALMINNDMKRWVIWTPEGYYASSPGGEELIGWHKNNGTKQEADFFPASRFPNFYRPDILTLVFKYQDTAKAIAKANSLKNIKQLAKIEDKLPPIVRILDPQTGHNTNSKIINLRLVIKTFNKDPVTETKILLNGRLYKGGERGIKIKNKGARKYQVKLEGRENFVSVLARNSAGWSEAATIKVNYKNSSYDEEFVIRPKLYILAIGVSNYADPDLKLKYPAKDASDFVNAMKKQENLIYRKVTTKLLTDENVTRDDILDGLDWIQRETTSKDVAMIFIAGHGMNDNTGNLYYLPQNVNLNRLKRTGLPTTEITSTISAIAGKVVYFMDTCHSGNMKVKSRRSTMVDTTKVVMELSSAENGAIVFASSTGRQYSLEAPKWNNGAFTKALVEGLNGKADYTGKGRISINMLDLYISERVKELTNGEQTPTTAKPDTIRDFPLAIVK